MPTMHTYDYAIVRVVPRVERGERMNVGVILSCADLDYLDALGALTDDGIPRHEGGISTTHPGLAYLGIEFQRSYASNTLRGVHRDAEHIAPAIAAHVRAMLDA